MRSLPRISFILITTFSIIFHPFIILNLSTMARQLSRQVLSELGLHDRETSSSTGPFQVAAEEHITHNVQGTYPRLCQLSDGSILFGLTQFGAEGEHILSVARSIDGGRTFALCGEVTRSRGDCDNMFILEIPPESERDRPVILAAFRNHDLNPQGSPVFFRITVCQSVDGGRTWQFLSQAFEKPAPFGLWEPFLRWSHGKLQLFFSHEMEAQDQDTMLVTSQDRGKTWSPPKRVTGMGERLRDGMVGIAETRDRGRPALVMVFETTRHGTFSVECVISYDDGESFGWRQSVYTPPQGRNAGAPQIASFADGSLAVVFMTDEDVAAPEWPSRAVIKTVFSGPPDEGNIQWSGKRPVSQAVGSWPGIMRVGENALLATYESSGSIRGRLLTRES
jgi:hypothetical protein